MDDLEVRASIDGLVFLLKQDWRRAQVHAFVHLPCEMFVFIPIWRPRHQTTSMSDGKAGSQAATEY